MKQRQIQNRLTRPFAAVLIALVAVAVLALPAPTVRAAAPVNAISYQGRLLDSFGNPVSDASAEFVFRLYGSAAGIDCLWQSDDGAACAGAATQTVALTDGLFSENIGSSVDPAGLSEAYPVDLTGIFEANTNVYLEVVINGETLTPRKQIVAAPYALNSQSLDGLDSTAFLSATGDTATGAFDFTGATIAGTSALSFEGGTINGFQTTFSITDPTADNTIIFQNGSGTIAFTSDIPAGSSLWETGAFGTFEDDDDVLVGSAGDETLSNAAFTLSGNDLFVADTLGVEGSVYSDGSFVAATTSYGNGAVTTGAAQDLSLAIPGGDLTFAQDTVVGDGGDQLSIDTSDWDISVAGNMTNIGSISADGTVTMTGDVTMNDIGADTIAIGAAADTVTIASDTLSLTDDNWNVTAGGSANFASIGVATPGSGAFTSLSANGIVSLGDGGDTAAVSSSGWSVSTAGTLTGIAAIASDDNQGTLLTNVNVTGADAGLHSVGFQIDGNTGLLVSATGDVAGGVGARTIDIGVSAGSTDYVNVGDATSNVAIGGATADVQIADSQWSVTSAGLITTADDVAVNGGDITTTSAIFNIANTNATTVSVGGAATTLNVGASGALARAFNVGTGTGEDTIRIGTGMGTPDIIQIGTGANANTTTIGTLTALSSLTLQDDNWNVTGTGAANFPSIGLATPGSGAFTSLSASSLSLSGNLDMANNLILSIGNAGTNFIAGGGLTLAGTLTANGVVALGDGGDVASVSSTNWSVTTAGLITTADDVAVNGGDITSTGSITLDSSGTVQLGTNDNFFMTGSSTHTMIGTETIAISSIPAEDTAGDAMTISFAPSDNFGADEANYGLRVIQTDAGTDTDEGADGLIFLENVSNDASTGLLLGPGLGTGVDFSLMTGNTDIRLQSAETITNSVDDVVSLTGTLGGDDTDISFDLDGTMPVISSNMDASVSVAENLLVGATTVAGVKAAFALSGDDIYAAGDIAAQSNMYADSFTAGDLSTTYADGSITTTADLSLAIGGADLTFAQNTRIGDGLFSLSIDSSDWDIGSTGNMTGIGTIDANGNIVTSGDVSANGGDLWTSSAIFNVANDATTLNVGSTNIARAINIGTGTGIDTISIGTGGTAADLITIGSSTNAWDVTSSGTATFKGSATFGDVSGPDELNFTTGATITDPMTLFTNTVTTGKIMTINANGLTTGSALKIVESGAAATTNGGALFLSRTAGVGSYTSALGYLNVSMLDDSGGANDSGYAAKITSAATSPSLYVVPANAAGTGTTVSQTKGGAIHVDNTINPDYGLTVYSAMVTPTSPLVGFENFATPVGAGSNQNSAGLRVLVNDLGNPDNNGINNGGIIIDTNEQDLTAHGSLLQEIFQVRMDADGNEGGTNTTFAIDARGDFGYDGTALASASDLAESYPSAEMLTPGEIVMTGPTAGAIARTTSAYSGQILGAISTNPGIVLGSGGADGVDTGFHVALAGRIPLDVTDENGSIAAGDPITSSSTSGYGMKSTQAGMIVGFALETYSGHGPGSISVFINPHFYVGSVLATDGSGTVVSGDLAMGSTGTASATTTGFDSSAFALRGSGWDGTVAQNVQMSASTDVTNASDYRLSIKNTAGSEVAYVSQAGDVALSGRLYPSDRGTLQTSKYIYYDGSSGMGGDFMRTNASGWATGSYDFAEMFPSTDTLVPGDVVMFGTTNESVLKSTGSSPSLAGIVSTRPGFLAGENLAGNYPIALAGRVPTKVSLENGPIAIGDPLTASATAGYAMKAVASGPIVGYALEAYSGAVGADDKIVAFVNAGYWNGGATSPTPGTSNTASTIVVTQNATNLSVLNMTGNVYLAGNDILGVRRIAGLSDVWSLEADGTVKTEATLKTVITSYQGDKVETTAVTSPDVQITLVGTATLVNGEATIRFEEASPTFNDVTSTTAPIRVIVTPNGPVSLYVTEKNHDGFGVRQVGGSDSDVTFDWMVSAFRKDYEPSFAPDGASEVEAVETVDVPIDPGVTDSGIETDVLVEESVVPVETVPDASVVTDPAMPASPDVVTSPDETTAPIADSTESNSGDIAP